MDFNLSEDQTMLKDSVRRFLDDQYSFEHRRSILNSEAGLDAAVWSKFAELGWLAIPIPEDRGGLGGGSVEIMVLMEEFGRRLVVEPYLSSIVLSGGLLAALPAGPARDGLLTQLMAGETKIAFAFAEPQAGYSITDLESEAIPAADGYTLNGSKCVVLGGSSADHFIISARVSDQAGGKESPVGLFIVPADAAGVARNDYRLVDGFRGSDLSLKDVHVPHDGVLCDNGDGQSILASVVDNATFAICAEAVGIMDTLYRTTVDYSKTREQFGSAIGQFQALQHRLVDMFIETEQTRSLLYLAAMKITEGAPDATQALSALKIKVGNAGRLIGQEAVQLHGGIGMTDDLDVSHYFKRLTVINSMFGNVDHHVRRFGSHSAT